MKLTHLLSAGALLGVYASASAVTQAQSFAQVQTPAELRANERAVKLFLLDKRTAEPSEQALFPGRHRLVAKVAAADGVEVERKLEFTAAPCTRYFLAADSAADLALRIVATAPVQNCDAQEQHMRGEQVAAVANSRAIDPDEVDRQIKRQRNDSTTPAETSRF